MKPKIIVGYEVSDCGRDALVLGRRLAEATSGELVVASAWVHEFYELPPPVEGYSALMRKRAERAAREAERVVGESGAAAFHVIGASSSARALHEFAEREHADLVVVGSTSRGALGRVLPGSVGERLLHGAPCAVAVAPRGFANRESTSLVPVGAGFDGSHEAGAALASAAGLARALGGQLRAISVWHRPSPGHPLFAMTSYHDFIENLERAHRDRVAEAVATHAGDLDAEAIVLEGEAVAAIARESADLGMLVVGSRGYGPLRRALLGGVSGRLLQTAACPVMVVPHGVEHPFGASAAVATSVSETI